MWAKAWCLLEFEPTIIPISRRHLTFSSPPGSATSFGAAGSDFASFKETLDFASYGKLPKCLSLQLEKDQRRPYLLDLDFYCRCGGSLTCHPVCTFLGLTRTSGISYGMFWFTLTSPFFAVSPSGINNWIRLETRVSLHLMAGADKKVLQENLCATRRVNTCRAATIASDADAPSQEPTSGCCDWINGQFTPWWVCIQS